MVGADLIRSVVVEQYTVASASMEPELHEGDRLVVNKVAYRWGEPHRGDIVVVDTNSIAGVPPHLGDTLVKRVIGLPGEVVDGVGGHVRIDGKVLDEPWLDDVETPDFGPIELSDEFVCQNCFMVKRTSQLANRKKMLCADCAY